MYVMATGGHVGSGAANANISLTSALGACGGLPTSTGITVNELTTVASAYALSGFASAATAPATIKFQGKSPGLDQAFNTLTNLTNTGTGTFETTGPETNQTLVQKTLDTVANALAACNASTTAGPCTELYTCSTPLAIYVSSGHSCTTHSSPRLATDTLSAALAITQNAGTVSTSGIYDLGTTTKPFTTVLTASPNDWTLPMVYAFKNYGPLAIDESGHVWVLTADPTPPAAPATPQLVVAEFDAAFNRLSPLPHYFNGGGLASFDDTDLSNLAIDGSGNVWIGGGPSSTRVAELSSTGVAVSPTNGYAAGSGPGGTAGITIDSAGDAWLAGGNTSTVFEMSPGPGSTLKGSTTGWNASSCPCAGIALGASGSVWIVGTGNNYLEHISSAGAQATAIHPPGAAGSTTTFYSIAADGDGNLWMADQHNHGVWEYSPSTPAWSPASGGPYANVAAANNPSHPKGIAIDGAGHIWVANESTTSSTHPASSLTELSADGSTNLSPDDGFGSGTIAGAYSVAIDGSGNVWVADGGSTIIQFIGAAAPTKNPIVTAVTTGFAP
jgi:sugar lactone lactonase YvrE